jgi:hypothetical protein
MLGRLIGPRSILKPDSIIDELAPGDGIQGVVVMRGRDDVRHANISNEHQANIASSSQKPRNTRLPTMPSSCAMKASLGP